MNTQYFRVTAYHPKEDLSVIIDSNGMYRTIDEFSSDLMNKGFNVIEASDDGRFLDVNLEKTEPLLDKIFLRAHMKGWFEDIAYEVDGVNYTAVKVGDKIYIPDKQNLCKQNLCGQNLCGQKVISGKPVTAAEPESLGDYVSRYRTLKADNPDTIVFYRAGDFYEVLSPDAETVSAMLNLALTTRDYGIGSIPVCGVPCHCADMHLQKLSGFGFKVMTAEPTK